MVILSEQMSLLVCFCYRGTDEYDDDDVYEKLKMNIQNDFSNVRLCVRENHKVVRRTGDYSSTPKPSSFPFLFVYDSIPLFFVRAGKSRKRKKDP